MGDIIALFTDRTNEIAVEIMRTNEFEAAAQKLSEIISLPLSHSDNGRLIAAILEQIDAAERGAFLQAFDMGLKSGQAAASGRK
jgi:hypothetical protein